MFAGKCGWSEGNDHQKLNKEQCTCIESLLLVRLSRYSPIFELSRAGLTVKQHLRQVNDALDNTEVRDSATLLS
jgi:hypothetical protein